MKIEIDKEDRTNRQYVKNIACPHCEGRLMLMTDQGDQWHRKQAIRAATDDKGWLVHCDTCLSPVLIMSDDNLLIDIQVLTTLEVRELIVRGNMVFQKQVSEHQSRTIARVKAQRKNQP